MEDVRSMNRSLCCVSDVFVRWILWFNGEGEQNESSTIVCDDLKDVNLSDIKGTSLSSEFEIADYDTINDSLHVFRSEVEGCSSDHHRCRYRTIKIHVAKSLFMKVVHLTAVSDAKFPDMELYAVIRHLWLIIRNKSPFLRVFAQQLLNDHELNNRLEAVHREVELNANQQTTHRKEAFFYDKLRDVVLEMSNSISLSVSDQFGSAAIASCNSKAKPLVCASLQHIDRFFKPRYMRMDGYFLINNHDCLCRVYEDLSSGFGLTVDVDFSDVFYDVQKNHSDKMVSIKIIAEKLSKTFNFRFFTFDCLEVCILRLAGVLEGLRFGNVQDKQMHIYYRESVFSSDMEMPSNLKVLSIVESKISCNLILPNSLEAITLEKVEIAENYELRVADACKRISIIGNAGRVRIPYVDRIFKSRFYRYSTVELLRSDNVIEKLTVIDATLPDCKIEVPENIREITLKRIRMDGKRPMILPKNIKKITIEDFKGNIRVHGLTFDIPLMCMLSAGSFCCSKTIENEELFEISISKAYISRSICFLPGVSTVNMSRVYINTDDLLNLNRNIKEVSLHNCASGRICFESMPYFHQILLGFGCVPPSVLSMFHFVMPGQNFRFSRLNGKETYRLFISDFKIRETTQFGPEVEEFEFHDVIVSSSDYVAIDRSFKKLALNGCEGRFKIPGIFSDSESRTIEMKIGVNRLVIAKTAEDSYDVLVCFCSFRKLTIEMNIATAEFYDTTVIDSLLITGQRCENLILDQFTGPISIPNVTSFKKIELSRLEQLDMSSNACTLLDKSEAMHFTSCNDPMSSSNARRTSPEFGESAASTNISAVLSDRCADICVLKCSIPINITGVLRNAATNMSPLRVMPTDEFELVSSSPENLTKLELVGNRIHGMWRVEKDVSFLSLSKVSSEEGSALYLNDGLESIRVHCSQLSIDATNAKNLRAITLINATSLVYNPSIHVSLSYLSVQEMTVSCNVDLTPCLHTFMLTRSTLTPGFVIRVNEHISHLSISKFIGVIDMSGVAGLGEMKMNDQHELYFDRRAVGKDGGSLHIVNCEFEKDVTFPDDLKNIRLKCIRTAPGVSLTLGQGCECLKLNSSTASVDFSRALRLKKIILKKMSLHVLKSLLAKSTTIEILVLQDMTIEEQVVFPSNLRTIVLQDVRVVVCSQLSFNQECIEVCFCRCIGTYDLSKIEKLEVLSLTPELNNKSMFRMKLPSLKSLRKLDVAYNLNNDCLTSDLFKSTSLESLTIRSLNYSKKHSRYPLLSFVIHDLYDFSGKNPWSARKLARYQLGPGRFQMHNANLLNLKMDIAMSEIFTFGLRNKLKYLNLVGCGLDEENIKALKEFASLQVLVIDCAFFGKELVENIPNQLETLEVVNRKIFDSLCENRCKMSSETFGALRECESIRHLVFTGCIAKCERIFSCLPLNLESLKIANFCAEDIELPAVNGKKIVIKRLTLVLDDPDCYPPVLIDNNPMKRQYYEVFDCLRDVIEFNELVDLMLEASGRCVSLDKETYRIK